MRTIVFDFDGTIADTLPELVKVLNSLSTKFGYKKIAPEEISRLRGLELRQAFKQLGISMVQLPFLVRKVKSALNSNIPLVKLQKNMGFVLLKLKENGFNLGILTSNSGANVKLFLKGNGIDVFEFIYSGSSIFGKGNVLKRLLRSEKLSLEEVVYVGDETRDIDAAKKVGVQIIAVSWGFNSRRILEKQKPDFLIDTPNKLIKIVERL